MSKGFASNYRLVILAALVVASLGGLAGRLVWLQVLHRDELLAYVDKAHREIIPENARRGNILDAHGNILATSLPQWVVGVDPQVLRAADEKKWPQLAELLGMPLSEVTRILTTKFRPAGPARPAEGVGATDRRPAEPDSLVFNLNLPALEPVAAPEAKAAALAAGPAPGVDDDTVADDPDSQGNRPIRWAKLSSTISEVGYVAIEKLGVQGVYGTQVYRRAYPDNGLAAHVIGYVNNDEKPVTGIEAYADFYLRGQNGWRETERSGRGEELAQFRSREVPAANGYSVKLSLDTAVQQIVEDELAAIAAKFQPLKATIIVSDPRTGFILALGNYPSFDLNAYGKLTKAEEAAMTNVATVDSYEPGSVFKIIPAAGALNDGLVTTATTFNCALDKLDYNDGKSVRTLRLPREDASDHFKILTVAQIIGRSSNRGAAQLGMMLGADRLYAYARAFGMGHRTDFPGGAESNGDLRPVARWDGLTITRLPMGQGVTATPIQMHQAMGVIASGGVLLRPQIIREIRDAQGEVVYRYGRSEVHRAVSVATAQTVARLLTKVASAPQGDADGGTAPEAAIPGYEVAGKTGTAQKVIDGRYSDKHHVSSFVGFFPASDPQVAISVIVDDADAHTPGGIGYGHIVAAPSFHRIGEKLIPYLDIRSPSAAPVRPALAMNGGRP